MCAGIKLGPLLLELAPVFDRFRASRIKISSQVQFHVSARANATMMMTDKVIVITGAARGIGFATAREALARGARVVICDVDSAAIDTALDKLKVQSGEVLGIQCDVSRQDDVERATDSILERHDRIDVLVNNAGTMAAAEALSLPLEHWRREIDICLTGAFLMAQSVASKSMIKHGGSIVNLGSGAAIDALPNCASYVAAKHGVVGLTKALAIDWAQYNIRVNCVCPGFTWTDLSRESIRSQPKMMEERIDRIPLRRGGEPEDIGGAILYLASDAAGFVTGQILSVDGGQSALSSGYRAPWGGLI
jgi:NAD(P)-dependent dehydrogenase (short-subunit alcohol dehydrogenase family)